MAWWSVKGPIRSLRDTFAWALDFVENALPPLLRGKFWSFKARLKCHLFHEVFLDSLQFDRPKYILAPIVYSHRALEFTKLFLYMIMFHKDNDTYCWLFTYYAQSEHAVGTLYG